MEYRSRVSGTIEAVPVTLRQCNLVAFELNGQAHLLQAEVWRLLFEPAVISGAPTADPFVDPALKARNDAAIAKHRKPAPPARKTSGRDLSENQAKALEALRARGPQTTAEVGEVVYPDLPTAKRLSNVWSVLVGLRNRGLAVRIQHNRIDKWAPADAEAKQ